MTNKLSLDFLKKFGLATQLTALKKLGSSNYNAEVNKLNKEITSKDLEGSLEDFLKTDLGTVLEAKDMESLFKLIDANGDGTISEEEAKELGQAGSASEGIDDEDIKAVMITAGNYNVETDNTDKTKLVTSNGKTANLVDISELPEGYSVSYAGGIYDSNFRLIGETRTVKKDINQDGVKEEVISYYLYEEDPKNLVTTKELPKGYFEEEDMEDLVKTKVLPEGSIIQDGKIYDKNYNKIGYVEFEDITKGENVITVARLFLYGDEQPQATNTEDNSRFNIQVSARDIPSDAYIVDNKILNKDGFQIGIIQDTTIADAQSGKSGTVRKYFLNIAPASTSSDSNTTASNSTTGTESTNGLNSTEGSNSTTNSDSTQGDNSTSETSSDTNTPTNTTTNTTPKELTRDTLRTLDGRTANLVNISDLPEGYSISEAGVIYDKYYREIGQTRTVLKDYDGDGIKDNIISYYLYEEDPKNLVTTKELPKGYFEEEDMEDLVKTKVLPEGSIIQDGKIYDKNYKKLGYVEFEDITKGENIVTIARLYLFDDKAQGSTEETEETQDTHSKYQITINDLPIDSYIIDNKIYNADGFQIGVIEETPFKDPKTGVTSTVKKYYFYE